MGRPDQGERRVDQLTCGGPYSRLICCRKRDLDALAGYLSIGAAYDGKSAA
jgi:hypothetical protein